MLLLLGANLLSEERRPLTGRRKILDPLDLHPKFPNQTDKSNQEMKMRMTSHDAHNEAEELLNRERDLRCTMRNLALIK